MQLTHTARSLIRAAFLVGIAIVLLWRFPGVTAFLVTHLWRKLTIPVFTVGTMRLNLLALIKSLLFFILVALTANTIRRILYRRISRNNAFGPQHSYVLARFASILTYVIGLVIGLQIAGVNLNALAILGGALGIGIGFGLQSIVANWVAGLVLLIEEPFRIGDRIDVGETSGVVGRVGVRGTWVRTYDNEVIIVPNLDFTTHWVTNWTINDDKVRLTISVVLGRDLNPQTVEDLILAVARTHPDVLADPPPETLLTDVAQSTLTFSLRFWTVIRADDNQRIKSDLRLLILKSLRQQGVEAPPTKPIDTSKGSTRISQA